MVKTTSIGRYLKKLRIDRDEIMLDMANKLCVSVSFLSAVETGKKKMPSSWLQLISKDYELNENQIAEFEEAIANTEKELQLNLVDLNMNSRELAISFARKLPSLDDKQIKEIKKIMEVK